VISERWSSGRTTNSSSMSSTPLGAREGTYLV